MKPIPFIHMADLHIGSAAYGKFHLHAMALLHEIVERANADGVEVLFLAGDIFNSPPTQQELTRLNTILSGFHHKVYMILGNHDRLRPLSRATSFRWASNIHLFPDDEMTNVYDSARNLRVFGMSWKTAMNPEAVYNEYFREHPLNPKEINVLLAHGGDEDHIPVNFEELSPFGFRYVAFGHLHQNQEPAPNVVYSGSLVPQDRTETGPHGYVTGTIGPEKTDWQLMASPAQYEELKIDVGRFYNVEELYRYLRANLDPEIRYLIHLVGDLTFDFCADMEQLYHAGQIEKITDETRLAIDYEQLQRYNADNILGIFIDAMKKHPSPLAEKALKFGVAAFLEAKDHEN